MQAFLNLAVYQPAGSLVWYINLTSQQKRHLQANHSDLYTEIEAGFGSSGAAQEYIQRVESALDDAPLIAAMV